jgi:Spy/CpxP family protein refolding chaperone
MISLSVFAVFSFLVFASPLLAQDSYVDFERGLNLTDAQRARVEDVKKKYMNEWRASGRDAVQKKLELRELSKNPTPNRERIEKLQDELLEIRASRDNMYNQYRGEVSRALSEQQREKYNSFTNSERRKTTHPLGLRGYGR